VDFDNTQDSAQFRLYAANQLIDEWIAADILPTRRNKPDGTFSTRRVVTGIALRSGEEIRIEGFPDKNDDAALDYIEILQEKD
jgi:hypothetical protein